MKHLTALVIISSIFLVSCVTAPQGTGSFDIHRVKRDISRTSGGLTIEEIYPGDQYIIETTTDRGFSFECSTNSKGSYIFGFSYSNFYRQKLEDEVTLLRSEIRRMAAELVSNLQAPVRKERLLRNDISLLPTTFVNIDHLYQTSTFGRYCSEQLANELHVLGLEVIEIRKSNELMIKEKLGELAISRVSNEIPEDCGANTVMLGTYTVTPFEVILNVRLVDTDNEEPRIRCVATGVFDKRDNLLINYLISDINPRKAIEPEFSVEIAEEEKTDELSITGVSHTEEKKTGELNVTAISKKVIIEDIE